MLLHGIFANHHRIYHNPRYSHPFWIQGAGPYNLLHLADYLSSKPFGCHDSRKNLQNHCLFFRTDIPCFICVGPPYDQCVNGHLTVLHIFFPIHSYHCHYIFLVHGPGIHLSPFNPGIHKGAQSDFT